MDQIEDIDLLDCPLRHGPGLIEEENGWCMYITCLDCGCQTAEIEFKNEEERLAAARQAATMWNIGKVISFGRGE